MPGQRGPEQRNLTKQVGIRLTPEEYERLLGEAQAAGLTLAALTRRRLLGLHITAQVDAGLIRELRRLGGLAKLGIRTPGMAESGRHALADIRSAIAHLAEPPS
ncbi:plasmid mobilization protein [Methylorubrum populi]|uniref:plasmid mobilization protein n=1 Tax=Methylorubrum populi TaxID=223967 RepID=UPI003F6606A4